MLGMVTALGSSELPIVYALATLIALVVPWLALLIYPVLSGFVETGSGTEKSDRSANCSSRRSLSRRIGKANGTIDQIVDRKTVIGQGNRTRY